MVQVVRDEFTFFHELRVRWSEVDPQGIVFNPNYLVYVDVAFTEYMRTLGFPYPDALHKYGADTFAVHSDINFKGSALFDDVLDIGVRMSKIGRTSMTITVGIFRQDTLLCDVRMTYVNGDTETKTPVQLPEQFIKVIEDYERVAPERKTPKL